MSDTLDAIVRLAAAVIAGMAIGLDRDLRGKPVGMRTLGLVGLAAALVTMASVDFVEHAVDMNPVSRVIQGVLTGIGFMGAGVIARDGSSGTVTGLTTAASVWVTAAIGVVCGLGAWVIVGVASVFALAILILGGRLEDWSRRWVGRREREQGRLPGGE